MDSKKMDTSSKDLISSLPDALICHILSFLSTKEAALTSVLSTRWRFLLAFVPNLDFGRPTRIHMHKRFKVFVNRIMTLQGKALLKKFSLRCEIYPNPPPAHGWILNVLQRGLVELDLDIASQEQYCLPTEVLMSKTLVILKIAGTEDFTIKVGDVFLPKLKTLHISDVSFYGESGPAFAKLISGCHALEELVMINAQIYWESFSMSNTNLKKVTIHCVDMEDNPMIVSFDSPNLVYFELIDIDAVEFPKVNSDSLVEASVSLKMLRGPLFIARAVSDGYEYPIPGDAAEFFMGISNVKTLYLSPDTLEVLAFCCKTIPVFNNLLHLTIETDQDVEWEAIPNLLENCPNLETLVFEGLHYKDTKQCFDVGYRFKDTNKCFEEDSDKCMCKPWNGTPNCISSSPVKTLKVLKYGKLAKDMDRQTDLIKYFVETMPNLEEVILYYDTTFDENLSIDLTEFKKLEKVASTKCKIQIISDNISFSSTVYSSSSSSLSGLVFFKNPFPV